MAWERVAFGVLGPVVAEGDGVALALKGPRHRAVLARLIVARRRVVPVARLVEDLWDVPPAGAVGAVQTFVGALRRALEPDRPPRARSRLLVTEGPGYALRAAPDAVDAWRFETAVGAAATLPPAAALRRLGDALELWRGPAYAEFEGEAWARGERTRLAELRLRAVERRAEALLALGRAAEAVPDLDAHVADHPWREDAWRLLALALYRSGRQGDALAVLRRARTTLVGQLGLDPGPRLRRLQADILAQDPGLEAGAGPVEAGAGPVEAEPGPVEEAGRSAAAGAARVWSEAAADYDRTVGGAARARLEATVGLIRNLAVTGGGGLEAARQHRSAAIAAAEECGDPELTARVIGAYDVPAIWPRGDDPELAGRIVAAAERTLAALPPERGAARCRLLATIALEMRGTRSPRGPEAAREAEEIARRLDDPALLVFALNGAFMQSCARAGLAPRRDAIGAELIAVAARHGLVTYEVLGHLVRLQARGALGDFPAADGHAAAADRLAARHELPLVGVFTEWYGALRLAAAGRAARAEAAYRAAAGRLEGAGMPGVERGLLPLALLCLRLSCGESAREAARGVDPGADWGPYRPWAEPFALLGGGDAAGARAALRALPEPPADLLYEALCCLEAAAAADLGDRDVLERARARLLPAAGQLAGAGSGLLTAGPVDGWLAAIAAASGAARPAG
ncbi:AfsR/SARP family transcriptional regulator [Streptomyces sp. NBRC 110028]|uniref:AfsR/SARP family transcriptional regulator n=1 Tax=Streptomyces sp. NBRC 110028 TaxID=1621260 RepID=UPI0006E3C0D0|nr:AfsR/SARP family transcriptional regulator [Streptomyces sp. NBRC 110028]